MLERHVALLSIASFTPMDDNDAIIPNKDQEVFPDSIFSSFEKAKESVEVAIQDLDSDLGIGFKSTVEFIQDREEKISVYRSGCRFATITTIFNALD